MSGTKSTMRYFESKQIHSTLACWSTEDMFVVREVTRADFLAHEGERTVSREHGFAVACVKADKTFYNIHSLSSTPKGVLLKHATERYLTHGWTMNHPFLDVARSAHYEDERVREKGRRTKQGYVIPEWSKEIPPESYQGGFSDTVFFHPALYDYVKGGGCFGFIGHMVRKPALDAYLESQFLHAEKDVPLLAMWLTSTGGRHFGDSLEGMSFKEQKAYVRNQIQGLVEQAKGYRQEDAAA